MMKHKLKLLFTLGLVLAISSCLLPVETQALTAPHAWCYCEKGEKGDQGYRGHRGPKGDNGERGLKGEPGTGLPANPRTVCMNREDLIDDDEGSSTKGTSLNPNYRIRSKMGENQEAALNLLFEVCVTTMNRNAGISIQPFGTEILKGEQGDKGEKGEVGEGLQGPVGPKGDRGEKGMKGAIGEKGMKGEKGEGEFELPTGTAGNVDQILIAPTPDSNTKGITFIHWGESVCPSSSNVLYSGIVVTPNSNCGNLLCIPSDPTFSTPSRRHSRVPHTHITKMNPVQYVTHRGRKESLSCSLCYKTSATSTFVFPGSILCPKDWNKEYSGFLYNTGGSDSVCVDEKLQNNISWWLSRGRNDLNVAEVVCPYGVTSCKNYRIGYRLPCTLCTK